MRKVSHIFKRKGNAVVSVDPETTVIDALTIMANKNIGSVVVMMYDKFLGIMTERDYSRKVILKGRASNETTVGEIMSSDFPAVTTEDSIDHCMTLMAAHNIRYLPVMQNDALQGIISINDVVLETIVTQKETIDHLHSYIHS